MPLVRTVIDNRIRLAVADLPAEVIAALKHEFEHTNPEYSRSRAFGFSAYNIPRTISTWRHRGENEVNFPRGGMPRIRRVLDLGGFEPSITDARVRGRVRVQFPEPKRPLWAHQTAIVDAIEKNETCIIKSATGSGKTTGLLAALPRLQVPTLVIVHSNSLAEQWFERFEMDLGMGGRAVGRIQAGRVDLQPATIAMQQTLHKLIQRGGKEASEVLKYFGAVLADEVHFFAANSFISTIDPFPAYYRAGASADHTRRDKKDFLILDLFGAPGVDVSNDQMVDAGHIVDVEIRILDTKFDAPWYKDRWVDKEEKRNFIDLCKEMAVDPARDDVWLPHLMRELAAGEQAFVLSHHREHCQVIAGRLAALGIKFGMLFGGGKTDRDEFAKTVAGLRSGELRVGIGTYKALGTGIDVKSVGVAVATTPIAGNRQFFNQVRGRVCRGSAGKSSARMYAVLDPAIYDRKHHSNLHSWNRTVSELQGTDWVRGKKKGRQ